MQKKQVDFSAHVRTLEEKTGTYVQRDVIYIGFIYTFYLQIFVSKSSLYTFIFKFNTCYSCHPHALVLFDSFFLETKHMREDFSFFLQFGFHRQILL